ncbi:hypothetical protein A2U01_0113798, partial [Trifolium medium]|nr:hypothetical protein [Trifolium medium]
PCSEPWRTCMFLRGRGARLSDRWRDARQPSPNLARRSFATDFCSPTLARLRRARSAEPSLFV